MLIYYAKSLNFWLSKGLFVSIPHINLTIQ